MAWKKGESGNPSGRIRPEAKTISDTLRRAALAGAEALRKGADEVVAQAAGGDLAAWAFLRDTLEGKPVQQVQAAVDMALTVEVVKFAAGDE